MSRPNYIAFVELLYKFNPDISDYRILALVTIMFAKSIDGTVEYFITKETLSVWKARLRKKGIQIPDQRKRKGTNG